MIKKEYNCCICGHKLNKRPHRLVHQENDNKETYAAFHIIKNYDFCDRCFELIINWITKDRKKVKNERN